MSYTIEEFGSYIEVKFEGYITVELLKLCVEEEIAIENYPDKNDIFDFRNAIISLSGYELPSLFDFIKLLYPNKTTRSKTAFIVSSGFQKGVAETFKDIASKLPLEIKIFFDKDSAEDWVKSNDQ